MRDLGAALACGVALVIALSCASDVAASVASSRRRARTRAFPTTSFSSNAPGADRCRGAGRHHSRCRPECIPGAIVINKPLTLLGEKGAEIRGDGSGKVVTIAADDVTLSGLRITGSGLRLSDDDAAVFVTGNRARIENNLIADSLHGIYLKKVSGAQILHNRIEGKTAISPSTEPVEKGLGQSSENCDTTLVSNRRGNGIHQWNCEGNTIRRQRNQRGARRHLFLVHEQFTRRRQPHSPRPLRPALHVFGQQHFPQQHLHGKCGRRGHHVLEGTGRARQSFHQ